MFAAIKIDFGQRRYRRYKTCFKTRCRAKLDKGSRKGINFYGFVDKSTCKYAIPFFFFFWQREFFLSSRKRQSDSTIFS